MGTSGPSSKPEPLHGVVERRRTAPTVLGVHRGQLVDGDGRALPMGSWGLNRQHHAGDAAGA